MRHVNKIIIVGFALIVSVMSVRAENGVPTYDQTAANMYTTYQESIAQNLSDFESESNVTRQRILTDIEAAIADNFGTSREHVQKMITDYKQGYVNTIKTEVDHLTNDMLNEYEAEKSELIEEEMTDEVATFLDDILSE